MIVEIYRQQVFFFFLISLKSNFRGGAEVRDMLNKQGNINSEAQRCRRINIFSVMSELPVNIRLSAAIA